MKKEKVSTINDLVYYESDEHADTISYSSKQVDASNKPITDTHIVEGVNKLSVGIVSVKPAVIGVGIIGRGITQGVISGKISIVKNIVTDISLDSSNQLFETNTFQLNSLQSEMLVIGSQDESMKITNRIISTPSESRNISGDRISRIDTPRVNKKNWGVIDKTSNVLSDGDNVDKFDTNVQSSTTQERNLELSRIEEESVKSIFPELGSQLDSSVQVNLANSVLWESPNFKRLGHLPMETADILNLNYIRTNRPKNCNGLRRNTDRDGRLRYTHDFETMIKTTAYRNHIKNS